MGSQTILAANNEKKSRFFYGYIIILASFLIVLISWGSQYSYGVFFKPVLNEFDWSRAVTSGAFSINMILTGAFSILTGRIADRFGPRLVLTISGLIVGIAFILMSRVSAIWQYYLDYGVLLSIGLSGIVVPLMSNVSRWFTRGRGLASGIVISGIGLGVLVMPQVANNLISTYDWRTSFIILGIVALILIVGFAQLLRRAPVQKTNTTREISSSETSGSNAQVQGLSTVQAMRTRQFWIICLIALFLTYGVQTIMVHIVAHATDIGYSASTAATILSAIGIVSIIGKILMGSLGDKISNRNVMIIISIILILVFIWLKSATDLWMLYLFAVVFAFGYAGWSANQPPLVAEFFGLKSHGTLYGLVQFAGFIGGALGVFLGGYIFDRSGSYERVFIICAVIGVVSLIFSIWLKPALHQSHFRLRPN